ncbi:2-(1,2-epoxy-1,2-dihydrophenyl)acetyl-CoA isomerase [Rubrobacter xylanophilus]|uniref:2-(1,2-epoxy-1,2-dihydrophenyl)acetyl-CoA isomerase n=1 Tax=Rubrobacter xylanophilus TaxID=49319 RepID=A0A510HI69_9ACTN|nr:enoyl-CoA hydratase-related protein [Rubrobacter xylanophilus]BBL79696.1 2-(1,2-epoxy-1,2-dihydrophenyl)acetyl-CoA isomerase [Rubrobacter xylanophilus]
MTETILYEKSGAVATISLNRPDRLNAFDGAMHRELHAALDEAAADEGVRCLVLRGEGRGFSAGADLKSEDLRREDGDPPDLGEYLRKSYSVTVTKMVEMEKPIVAALHGPVYGAGVGVALACDMRVAAESARFSVAFIKIGLMPDAGVSFFLPRVVGLGRAMEMSMLGEEVDAEEAHRIGLVNRVVPDERLREEAAGLARRLAALPTRALAQIKRSLYSSFESNLETALEREAGGQSLCGRTADHREGVAAFFERREPRFSGR